MSECYKQQSEINIKNAQLSRIQLETSKDLQCRICLQIANFPNQNQNFVSPCHCTGSLKFVHAQCLQNWISRIALNGDKNTIRGKTNAYMHCELCSSKIFFKVNSKMAAKNIEEIAFTIKKQYRVLIVLFLALLASLGFFSALLNYLLFVGFKTLYNDNVVIVSLVITGQVIFFILSLIIIGAIIKKFFLKQIVNFQVIAGDLTRRKK